jgi:hypothetical protein
VSNDQDQEEKKDVLPKADGPLVDVTLPDGQHLYAVVKSRVREPDGSWWYDLQIHLPSQASDRGRLLALPAAIDFRAPAALCQPIDGQPYDQVPTTRPGTTPAWKVEEKAYFGPERGPARIIHRGNCHANHDYARPASTEQARTILVRGRGHPQDHRDRRLRRPGRHRPLMYDHGYYAAPDGPTAARPYALLVEALARTGRYGIAKFAVRTRERLAVLRPRHGVLIVQAPHWPQEIRDPSDITSPAPVTEQELAFAETLIAAPPVMRYSGPGHLPGR